MGEPPVFDGDIHETVISPSPTDLTYKSSGAPGGSRSGKAH
jgi:hypothetical protein